jgi:hypothetical protein
LRDPGHDLVEEVVDRTRRPAGLPIILMKIVSIRSWWMEVP